MIRDLMAWLAWLPVAALPLYVGAAVYLIATQKSAVAHSWYPPECCSDQDCRPVPLGEAREGPGGTLLILINGTWRIIPPEIIKLQPSPDGLLHVCYSRYPNDSMPRLYCVFLPVAM